MNRKIIAIDDDTSILNAYRTILEPEQTVAEKLLIKRKGEQVNDLAKGKFQLTTADQGETGFELFKKAYKEDAPFAVALIDMRMPPGWGGLQTAQALRELDDRIYIVIVTAYSEYTADELQEALLHDVFLLRKPFVSEEIKQMANNLCNSWQRDREMLQISNDLMHASKVATVGEMASGMVHEINSPLATIMLSSYEALEILEEGPEGEDFDELPDVIKRISTSSKKIDKLVKHLLRFVRRGEGIKRIIKFDQVIEESMLIFGKKFANNDITFQSEIQDDLPEIYGDPHQFEQIFINLFNNAIDAMEGCQNKSINLNISKCNEKEGFQFRISDSGMGIAEENRKQIFQSFFTTKDVDKGTGLGLSILKTIVESYDGDIDFESTLGEGTTFIINIPSTSLTVE